MKKSLVQKAAVTLIAMIITVSFAACGEGGRLIDTENPTDKKPTGAKRESFEVVTLEVFSLPSNKSGLVEGWWADILEEDLSIRLELIPAGDQGEQRLQALMAGGELPDIVVFKSKRAVIDAVRADMLVCLDDHLEKLPNVVQNASEALQYYRQTASDDTGKAYSIPNDVGPGAIGAEINWGPFLRWDLYKRLGMPKIGTLEDYLPLLKQMQQLEPVNEEGQKVYGITLWRDWDGLLMQQATTIPCMFGVDSEISDWATPFLEIDYKTGETKSVLDPDSEYIRALRFFFKANQMGLVDPDSLTQRFETALGKAKRGRVLFGFWPWLVSGYNTAERVNADPPSGFRPVLCEDYKAFIWEDNTVGHSWSYSIGSATKNLDAALRFVDYMYSADGLMKMNCGPKGYMWDIDENGQLYITDVGWNHIENEIELPGGGMLYEAAQFINSSGLSPAFIHPEYNHTIHYQYWDSSKTRNPDNLMKDWSKITGYSTTSDMLLDKNMYTPVPLASSLVPAVTDDILMLSAQIGDVIKTNSWLMVFSENEEEFEQHYRDMIAKAESYGIQKVLDWSRKAWERAKIEASRYE